MTELIWDGKYKDGKRVASLRVALPFQTVETVNETTKERQHAQTQKTCTITSIGTVQPSGQGRGRPDGAPAG